MKLPFLVIILLLGYVFGLRPETHEFTKTLFKVNKPLKIDGEKKYVETDRVIVHLHADGFKFSRKMAHNKKKGNRDTVRLVETLIL